MTVFNLSTYRRITELSEYVSPIQVFEIIEMVIERLDNQERAEILELLYNRYFGEIFGVDELDF
ncbi:hypothetical protein [Neobacillus sp. PS3-40]|uniref:hypothetical protein n=1 Tax=Neobacillus sp. PS3-40 TaxID=3070679 RepID=UPI0027DFD9E2|nr:hypothetical protein [Neobacillus sp. PS3-40]WML43121.1 hypothetical protein RCG20_15100 [Neobacillus sp. PS3-40]